MGEKFSAIILFINNYLGKYDFPLERKTKIQDEMGITGIEAEYFIVEYGKYFNVDVSNFAVSEYFDPEQLYLPFKIPFFKYFLPKSRSKDLTLGDLENGVLAGKLDETIIGR